MRPHIVHLEQQAVDEAALYGSLQGVEVVIADIRLQSELAEPGQWALAGSRINQVDLVSGEEMMPRAADIADLCDNITGQLLLDHEVPVLVREILTMAVNRFRAKELVLRVQERHERIRQCWKVR